MTRTRSRSALWGTVATGAVLALGLTACGGPSAPQPGDASGDASGGASSSSTIPDTSALLDAVQVDDALAAQVPADIKDAGTLVVGSNVQSAPNNFYAADGSTVIGSDHDLITAVGKKLGLDVEYQNQDFGSLITSLQSGRVDVTIAAMNDTAERQQAIDFVDYLTSGITLMVQKGNPDDITGPDALCGKSIAVVTGTSQQEFAEATSTQCESDGEEALDITVTDSDSQNQTQLRTGRIDAIVNDLPSAVYISKTAQDGQAFEVVPGDVIDGAPYGIGVNKDDAELRDAIAAALDSLIDDGTYGEVLDAWGITSGSVTEATVNGGK
ncbi:MULTISPECIES: ABC transporter substrate-binding protein [unclassified Frigoribacterium]|jgi:polar amino acid transport system substrate-binding protein|uniref:ABC transporter substrate-binding protein n=1 Tax=unclassified Frigoribacterium TaxID=2627005 RepID=UPI0006F6304D|nr:MULTISPECIES: ABC transporter substrate-binding protein [unclassified Frigoribacterium]KQN45130.1 ABC transporter substrate-binding protein [Frigoribacterium sp. Leaf44]MBD8539628.1 ABC transporter substrate-binding protein [Frigoribacterium sp. CFBP 8751]